MKKTIRWILVGLGILFLIYFLMPKAQLIEIQDVENQTPAADNP